MGISFTIAASFIFRIGLTPKLDVGSFTHHQRDVFVMLNGQKLGIETWYKHPTKMKG